MNSRDENQAQYDLRCEDYRVRVKNARKRLRELDSSTTPALYAMMTTRGDMRGKLASLMDYIINIPRYSDIDSHGNGWAAIDMRRLVSLYRGGLDTWERYLALLSAFGLLLKKKPIATRIAGNAEKALLARAEARKQSFSSMYSNPMMRYAIPEFTDDLIAQAELMAKHWLDGGYSMRGVSKATIISAFGQKVADRAYRDIRKISPKQIVIAEALEKSFAERLASLDYAIPSDMIEDVAKTSAYSIKRVENVWGRIKGDILEKYSLSYRRPSSEEIARLQLKGLGWILVQDKKQ